jgi:hypothetical protein
MVFMTINSKEQIGDKATKYLNHQPILAFCNQMINLQMAFPPGKKAFDFPSELIYFSTKYGCGMVMNWEPEGGIW